MTAPVLDIPRLYTALAEWLACMIMVTQYRHRLRGGRYVLASAAGLLVQTLFLVLTDNIVLWLWLPCMGAAMGLMLGLILLLRDVDLRTGAYICIRAFILAEFAAAIEWQLHCFVWPESNAQSIHGTLLLLLVYALVFGVMYLLEGRCRITDTVSGTELMIVLIIGAVVFAVSNLSFYFGNTPFSGHYAGEIMNIRTFADLGGTAILFAYHLQRGQLQARREVDAMQTILENQYAQYRMSRDSIDMINRKYHDLKHQIAALRAEPDAQTRNQWLDEMEADIRSYEAQNKTGNTVLDTVLTGKSLYCQKHSIALTLAADGRQLGFMDVMDICTLFGNALDNAIECQLKIADKSRRAIHLTLNVQKKFLVLRVENYCPDPPVFRNGLPLSTKGDAANHGFGVKSIQHTARKYGGSITVTAENEWFVLKVLLPIPSSKA